MPCRVCHGDAFAKNLTAKPTGIKLVDMLDGDIWHIVKQTQGGKVQDTQPPATSGFFIPAACPRDCNQLLGVARNKIPPSGNTCSVTLSALNGSRQPYNCQHVKKLKR